LFRTNAFTGAIVPMSKADLYDFVQKYFKTAKMM